MCSYVLVYVCVYVFVCLCVIDRDSLGSVLLSVCLSVCLSERERDCLYHIIIQTYDVGLLSTRHPRHAEEMRAQ